MQQKYNGIKVVLSLFRTSEILEVEMLKTAYNPVAEFNHLIIIQFIKKFFASVQVPFF